MDMVDRDIMGLDDTDEDELFNIDETIKAARGRSMTRGGARMRGGRRTRGAATGVFPADDDDDFQAETPGNLQPGQL